MKILVVDDHPLVRDAMSQLVSELGGDTTVLQAPDCAAGLEAARANSDIDLVLLDLNLPGLRGIPALERFRRDHPAMPVVIVSMFRDRETVHEAIRRGAIGFIPKSSSRETIANALRLDLTVDDQFLNCVEVVSASQSKAVLILQMSDDSRDDRLKLQASERGIGVVHRLESKNAYFACRQLHKARTGKRPMFLSCEKCGAVQEVDGDEIFGAIDAAAHGAKFEPRVRFAEVSGTCHECATRRQS